MRMCRSTDTLNTTSRFTRSAWITLSTAIIAWATINGGPFVSNDDLGYRSKWHARKKSNLM